MACRVGRANQFEKARILLGPIGQRVVEPRVIAGSGDSQDAAHGIDIELVPMRIDKLVGLPNLAWIPVCGHRHLRRPPDQILALSRESW